MGFQVFGHSRKPPPVFPACRRSKGFAFTDSGGLLFRFWNYLPLTIAFKYCLAGYWMLLAALFYSLCGIGLFGLGY